MHRLRKETLIELHSNNKTETLFKWLIQNHTRLRDSKIKGIISLNINPRNMKVLYFGVILNAKISWNEFWAPCNLRNFDKLLTGDKNADRLILMTTSNLIILDAFNIPVFMELVCLIFIN